MMMTTMIMSMMTMGMMMMRLVMIGKNSVVHLLARGRDNSHKSSIFQLDQGTCNSRIRFAKRKPGAN